jgi:hypothetical protein
MIGIAPKLSTAWRSKGMWRWRNSYSDPNVSWLHTRVLVSNLLHNPADNRGTINSFCKTAIIDRLLGHLAEQSRRISNRMLDEFHQSVASAKSEGASPVTTNNGKMV